MTSQDDAPFGIFRLGYTLLVWAGVALLASILAWVIWTLLTHTSAGTTTSQRLGVVRPTQTAIAASLMGAAGSAPGEAAFRPPVVCTSCHVIAGQGQTLCPNLDEIGVRAEARIADQTYTGTAKTAEDYIRESILEPSKFCVPNDPGKVYCAGTTSIMPEGLASQVEDLDALVTFLANQGR